MTPSMAAACAWIVIAAIIAMMPRKIHWRGAYVLIAALVPLAVWVVAENGWLLGLLFLAGAGSMLRWPLRFLARWIGGKLGVEVRF